MKNRKGYLTWYQAFFLWLRDNWRGFLISTVISLACMLIYCILNGWNSAIYYSNGLFIGGASTILVGLLVVVALFGGTDIFTYYVGRKRTGAGKEDFYQYSERKKGERMKNPYSFVPYLFIGAVVVTVSILLSLPL